MPLFRQRLLALEPDRIATEMNKRVIASLKRELANEFPDSEHAGHSFISHHTGRSFMSTGDESSGRIYCEVVLYRNAGDVRRLYVADVDWEQQRIRSIERSTESAIPWLKMPWWLRVRNGLSRWWQRVRGASRT